MTSKVTIEAVCSSDLELHVTVMSANEDEEIEKGILQNGESTEKYVYDDRRIIVEEIDKQ